MNRIVTLAAGALALGVLAGGASAQTASATTPGGKIGVIEVQKIVQESAIGKESLARVQKVQQAKQEDLQKRQKELRDMEQKIQDQGKSLSEDAMEKLQKDYQAKALDLKRFQDDAQRELEESQRKELGELEKRIMPVINEVAREQGYALVFNKFNSGLLFADDKAVDLTEAVITKFNSQIAAPAAPAAAKPAAPAAAKPPPRRPRRPPRPRRRSKPGVASFSVAEVAAACGGRVVGDGERRLSGVRSLEGAGADTLSFVSEEQALPRAAVSAAGALLARSASALPGRTVIEVPDPSAALILVLRLFHPARIPRPGIHVTAVVDAGTFVDPSAEIGPYAVVGDLSRVEANAIVGAHTVIGARCRVGAGSWLHPHVVLYDDVVLGERVEIHSGAVLGGDGFGYATTEKGLVKIPQVGGVTIGDDVEIGANTCIDRAALETTSVGAGTKIDDLVMLGHNVRIGRHDVLCAQVGRRRLGRDRRWRHPRRAGGRRRPHHRRQRREGAGPERHRGGRAGRRGAPRDARVRVPRLPEVAHRIPPAAGDGASRAPPRPESGSPQGSRGMSEQSTGRNILEIMRLLPHRYPFLLVDRIVSMTEGPVVRGLESHGPQERLRQRAVLPGPFSGEPGHARRPHPRVHGSGRRLPLLHGRGRAGEDPDVPLGRRQGALQAARFPGRPADRRRRDRAGPLQHRAHEGGGPRGRRSVRGGRVHEQSRQAARRRDADGHPPAPPSSTLRPPSTRPRRSAPTRSSARGSRSARARSSAPTP